MLVKATTTNTYIPVNISTDVGHFHAAADNEATCEIKTMLWISPQQLMVMCKRVTEHLIQPAE